MRETPEVATITGPVEHLTVKINRNTKEFLDWTQKNPGATVLPPHLYALEKAEVIRLPSDTPPDWTKPEADDSGWARVRVPTLANSQDEHWKLIQVLSLFDVPDTTRAGHLLLSLSLRGGAVVYINGEEIARAYLPAGEITPDTSAEPYPDEVYLDADGYVFFPNDKREDVIARLAKRVRTLECKIPAKKLRKGVNVLAIGIHRAPTNL